MIGNEIRRFIVDRGLKLSAIAERTGIPLNTFSAMVNEKRKITAEEYFSICKALDVPLEQFASVGE